MDWACAWRPGAPLQQYRSTDAAELRRRAAARACTDPRSPGGKGRVPRPLWGGPGGRPCRSGGVLRGHRVLESRPGLRSRRGFHAEAHGGQRCEGGVVTGLSTNPRAARPGLGDPGGSGTSEPPRLRVTPARTRRLGEGGGPAGHNTSESPPHTADPRRPRCVSAVRMPAGPGRRRHRERTERSI